MRNNYTDFGEAAIIIAGILAGVILFAITALVIVACEPKPVYTDCFDCRTVTTFEDFSANPKTVTVIGEFEYCDQPAEFGGIWSKQNTYSDTTNHMTQKAYCKQRIEE
jgi:hypothetical protein